MGNVPISQSEGPGLNSRPNPIFNSTVSLLTSVFAHSQHHGQRLQRRFFCETEAFSYHLKCHPKADWTRRQHGAHHHNQSRHILESFDFSLASILLRTGRVHFRKFFSGKLSMDRSWPVSIECRIPITDRTPNQKWSCYKLKNAKEQNTGVAITDRFPK